jgi:co-chaperonin GroES (HSP10)
VSEKGGGPPAGQIGKRVSIHDITREARKAFTPIGKQLAVVVDPVNETAAGLHMPDGSVNPLKTMTGRVVAAGPKCEQVKDGDVVLLQPGAGGHVVITCGGTVLSCHEETLLGVLDDGLRDENLRYRGGLSLVMPNEALRPSDAPM